MKMKFSKWQLIALFLFGTAMFSLGIVIIVKDMHIVGAHSYWNKVIGSFFMVFSMCTLFPVQTALALKMLKENIGTLIPTFGYRKGEIPPPTGIEPGTPVDESKTSNQSGIDNARTIQIREGE